MMQTSCTGSSWSDSRSSDADEVIDSCSAGDVDGAELSSLDCNDICRALCFLRRVGISLWCWCMRVCCMCTSLCVYKCVCMCVCVWCVCVRVCVHLCFRMCGALILCLYLNVFISVVCPVKAVLLIHLRCGGGLSATTNEKMQVERDDQQVFVVRASLTLEGGCQSHQRGIIMNPLSGAV